MAHSPTTFGAAADQPPGTKDRYTMPSIRKK
jgi:hypothetical protein